MFKQTIDGKVYTCFSEEECLQITKKLTSFEDKLNKIGCDDS